ncbi:hypothetical protein HanOQP8_Chr16g0622601 [Helianthus annuus]|nr:hypothetical protein HanOQP8_Chr16g0622601 [Helianthus annuus]
MKGEYIYTMKRLGDKKTSSGLKACWKGLYRTKGKVWNPSSRMERADFHANTSSLTQNYLVRAFLIFFALLETFEKISK